VARALGIAVKSARARSKAAGLAFDIDANWAIEQAERQRYRCALTGIAFYMPSAATSYRHPFLPSLDRIHPASGYTKDNVRIVIWAINVMLLDWGHETFERVVSGYRYTKGTRHKLPSRPLSETKTETLCYNPSEKVVAAKPKDEQFQGCFLEGPDQGGSASSI